MKHVKKLSIKLSALCVASLLTVVTTPTFSQDITQSLNKLTQKSENKEITSNALTSYAANQLGMSESTVNSGLGSLFKVAKDNLSQESFALITKAIPDINSYIAKAPSVSTSSLTSLTSLLGKSGDSGKTAASISYLDSALKEIGLSKEQLPAMLDSVTGYLDKNGYGEAAGLLKQGLNFL